MGARSRRCRPAFGDDEGDVPVLLLLAYDQIACFPNEMGNINPCERIRAAHLQMLANRNSPEGLAGLEDRQRAFEAGKIEQCDSHGANMSKEDRQVNRL